MEHNKIGETLSIIYNKNKKNYTFHGSRDFRVEAKHVGRTRFDFRVFFLLGRE